MNVGKNKTKAILATFLVLTFVITLIALPTANAHSPPWTITTHAFITVNPNPVGVGQRVIIVVWAGLLLPSATVSNNIRFHDYKVTITRPDGETETITWDVVWDSTSTAWAEYTPNQVGTYKFVFSYPDQVYTWSGTYQNDTYLGATSKTLYLQ